MQTAQNKTKDVMNDDTHNWITLSTTPPESPVEFDRLVAALDDAGIAINVEENVVRQCENDPAFWLRVRVSDVTQALELARRLNK